MKTVEEFVNSGLPAAGDKDDHQNNEIQINTPEEIWEAFKSLPEEDLNKFMAMHGYAVDEIEAIGRDKFIQAMDWTNVSQVMSWKTDAMHNIICPECRSNFGILELDAGLCKDCVDSFYAEFIADFDSMYMVEVDDGSNPISAVANFILFEDFRKLFRKETGDLKQDVQTNEVLRLTILSRALNDYIATETAKNGGVAVKKAQKGLLLNYIREYPVPGRLVIKRDLPCVYEALKDFTTGTVYDEKENAYDLFFLSYDIAIKLSKLANEQTH